MEISPTIVIYKSPENLQKAHPRKESRNVNKKKHTPKTYHDLGRSRTTFGSFRVILEFVTFRGSSE